MTDEHKPPGSESEAHKERNHTRSAENLPAEREGEDTARKYHGGGEADVFADEDLSRHQQMTEERTWSESDERELQETVLQNGAGDEMVIIGDENPHQRDILPDAVKQLNRLYYSLCGGQPGLYWPGSLLDATGGISRPAFPVVRVRRK